MRRVLAIILSLAFCVTASGASGQPNVVVILADDLGYGDLSVQGHPLIRTPNLDRLAREGQRWTSFYAAAPLCNPSRVALMTGRLPARINGTGKNQWMPLPDAEVTLAELLRDSGYATGYIGKWGIGDASFAYPGSHPNDQGFDYFYGLPHSNDSFLREGLSRTYENVKQAASADFPIPLYRQRKIIEATVHQPTLTRRYTEESIEWLRSRQDQPFLLFLAHSMPHVPIFPSPEFAGRSAAGVYGDVIEELDWSVGQVVEALREAGVARNTLVIFSSDNGPWRTYYDLGGSSGPLRDGKLTAWEGGVRVPGIFWWPGRIQPAVINDIGVNVDLMETIASLAGAALPTDRKYDSVDLSQTLLHAAPSPRQEWFFYGMPGNLWAARVGPYKLVLESWESVGKDEELERGYANHRVHTPPLLFDLRTDVAERLNIADRHPEVVARIGRAIELHRRSLGLDGPEKAE